jgi:hypothetical protein
MTDGTPRRQLQRSGSRLDLAAETLGGLRRSLLSSGHRFFFRASTASERAFDDRLDLVAIYLRRERTLDPGHRRADIPELSVDTPELSVDTPELTTDIPELSVDTPELSVDTPELTTDIPELSVDTPELTADIRELTAELSYRAAVLEDSEVHLTEPPVDLLAETMEVVADTLDLVADTLECLAEDVELRVQILENDHERSVAAGGRRPCLLSGGHRFFFSLKGEGDKGR